MVSLLFNKVVSPMTRRWFPALMLALTALSAPAQTSDTELLGRALDYFASEKYHEALLLFQQLDQRHRLNARFKTYIGLCYYHDWDYKSCVKYLDAVEEQLAPLDPHEQNVYCYAAAESYFQLQDYEKALPRYERCLTLCYPRERGDIYYRIGLCHMMAERWVQAIDAYTAANHYLGALRNADDVRARRAQTQNMIKGCQEQVRNAVFAGE